MMQTLHVVTWSTQKSQFLNHHAHDLGFACECVRCAVFFVFSPQSHAGPSDVSHLSPSALLAVAVDEQSQDFPHEHSNPASSTYIQLISASPANVTTMYMLVNAAERVLLERIFREEAMKKYVNEDGKPNELAQLAPTLK